MTNKIIAACFFTICIVVSGFFSVSAQELKLGVFDIQRVMKESKTVGSYRQDFLKTIESKRKPLLDKEAFIKAIEEKIKKDGNSLLPGDRKSIEEKLATEVKEARRMKEDFDTEVMKMDRGLAQKTFSEIDGIIRKINEQENYTIIFEKTAAGIVHFKNTVDITGKILEQLK